MIAQATPRIEASRLTALHAACNLGRRGEKEQREARMPRRPTDTQNKQLEYQQKNSERAGWCGQEKRSVGGWLGLFKQGRNGGREGCSEASYFPFVFYPPAVQV